MPYRGRRTVDSRTGPVLVCHNHEKMVWGYRPHDYVEIRWVYVPLVAERTISRMYGHLVLMGWVRGHCFRESANW